MTIFGSALFSQNHVRRYAGFCAKGALSCYSSILQPFRIRHLFADVTKTAVRVLAERTLTHTHSSCTYTTTLPFRRRNASRNGIAQTAPRLWQPPQMSFRGATRRENPLNRNENTVAVATDLACFRNHYRAENLCYQNKTDKTQTAIPQDCLLDARLRLVFPFHRVFTKSTEFPVLFFYSLDFQFSNRAPLLKRHRSKSNKRMLVAWYCICFRNL